MIGSRSHFTENEVLKLQNEDGFLNEGRSKEESLTYLRKWFKDLNTGERKGTVYRTEFDAYFAQHGPLRSGARKRATRFEEAAGVVASGAAAVVSSTISLLDRVANGLASAIASGDNPGVIIEASMQSHVQEPTSFRMSQVTANGPTDVGALPKPQARFVQSKIANLRPFSEARIKLATNTAAAFQAGAVVFSGQSDGGTKFRDRSGREAARTALLLAVRAMLYDV